MLTILIAARNAEDTIERAVSSCANEGSEIILIDDHSSDATSCMAQRSGGKKLRIVTTPDPGGVSIARQAGLDAVQTPYAAWLDADDEWLPGRAGRLIEALDHGSDVVVDSIELYNGLDNTPLRRLPVPNFICIESTPVRLFERNYLPGDTQVGFRTKVFRDAGEYDPCIFGPESYDMLLRVIANGARFTYLRESGYRMYAYPDSVSRNLSRIRHATALALKKHDYENVRLMCLSAGYNPRVAAWVLVSMAIFREEYRTALDFLEHASPVEANSQTIIEPAGPLPLPEGWRRAFHRGSLLLLIGGHDREAASELHRAETILPTAEGVNNLGVARMRLGRTAEAVALFAEALNRFPDYLDAKLNLKAERKGHITSHPIRRQAARFEYETRA